MAFKVPDITVLPGGRKVRTDLRPYSDEVVTQPEPEEESAPKPKAKSKAKAEEDE